MVVDIDQVLATEQVHAEDLMNSGNISWRLNVVFSLPGFNVVLQYICYLKKVYFNYFFNLDMVRS